MRNWSITSKGQSVFNGKFTVESDRAVLGDVVKAVFELACTRRRASGDLAAWRRMVSLERFWLDGCVGWQPTYLELSLESFLERYAIPAVDVHVEAEMTALHYATYEDNARMVRLLIEAKADIEARDVDAYPLGAGSTPLFYAALMDASDALAVLLEHNASIDQCTLSAAPVTWLLAAGVALKKSSAAHAMSTLLSHGADPALVFGEKGWLADRGGGGATGAANGAAYLGTHLLAIAAAKGNLAVMRVLLEAGAPIAQRCEEGSAYAGMDALEVSRAHQQPEVEQLLLEVASERARLVWGALD
eukprot:1683777-Prymnesium_polylepis.5